MHKQDNTTTDKGLNTIVERMYGEGDYMDDPTLNPDWQKAHRSASLAKSMDNKGETEIAQQVRDKGINASKIAQPDDEGGSLFSTVAGDPNEWEIGQIIPSEISSDDYDGIILGIGEENGERTFDVMQVGEEGWTIYTSNLNLPDDDTGRVPPDALPGSNPIGV